MTVTRRVRTDTLMRRLFRADSLKEALRQNEQQMGTETFPEYLTELCAEKGMIPEHVIRRSDIDRTYGHQLFNGTRKPSRDKALQIAFGLGLTVEETQKLLRTAGKSQLYPRIRRDAVLIFALHKGMDILAAQELLEEQGLTLLGSVSRLEEQEGGGKHEG